MEHPWGNVVGRRIHPPPPPPPPPPLMQGFDGQKFGGSQQISQEIGTSKNCARARWNHQMKAYLIGLLKDHDVPKYRTQNAWSKEAWTSIVGKFNQRFDVSFTPAQVKQKEQDLKKDFKVVKDLISESGFGWDPDRMMVVAPDNVWAALQARKNKDALQWRDKSFPHFDDLFALYDGRYATGRNCHGMDYYANKEAESSQVPTSYSTPLQDPESHLHTPTPTIHASGESSIQFGIEEDTGNTNWFGNTDTCSQVAPNSTQGNDPEVHVPPQATSAPITSQHVRDPRPSSSAHEAHSAKRSKKQKTNNTNDDFHERYLKLKKEEIDRFAAIEERKLKDPFSIRKCIKALEKLENLPMGDMLKAADLFTNNKENREVFLSFSSNELRLGWLNGKVRDT